MLASILTSLIAINGFVPQVAFESRPSPDQAPTLQLGVLSEPLRGDLSLAARTWALSNRERLGLHPASTLVFETGFATRFGASLHYRQVLNGVDVYQGKLVVTVDQRARVVQVSSSVVGARTVKSLFLVDEAQALAKAATKVPFPALRRDDSRLPYGGAQRAFFAIDDALRAGWLVHVASYDPSTNWYVAIDAETGDPFFVQNRVHHAEFDANVYPISPGPPDGGGVGITPTVIGSLLRPDGGSFIGQTCELFLADGGFATVDNDAGVLCGDQLTTYNCCTNQDCVPDAGPRRIAGPTSIMGFTINLDLPVCDRVNQATNQRDAGDYRYAPVDPPVNRMAVDVNDPANSDTFAHVHAFYHVNRVYDWLRGLSGRAGTVFPTSQPAIGPFRMRDERRTPARKPAVLTNVVIPDFQNFGNIEGIPQCLPPPIGQGMGTCRVRGFGRVDNAAFLPSEQFAQLPIPGLSTGVDTLMIFQGNAADAAYDATVLWHEFGHGVVYATAALTFEDVALDNRSANNEGGALHEGLADYIAGAFGNSADVGPYFGPRALGAAGVMGVRQDGYLRSMNNALACPGVLWGQVHQDSQHVSAALWQGRLQNLGTDNGATYDAAFYAMLVSVAPNATFADVARVMAARVSTAFSPAAGTALEQIFQTKGVTGCSKVLEVTDASPARPYFGIPQASMLPNAQVPGPFQFKIAVPAGAQAIRIRGQQQGGGGFGGGMPPALTVLAKTQSPVTFTRAGANLTNDAEFTGTARSNGGGLDARVDVRIPCGATQEVYVALTSRGGGAVLQNLQVTAEPLVGCMFPVPDAGVMPEPDAGVMPEPDGGAGATETKRLAYAGTIQQPTAVTGCGCTSLDGTAMLALIGVVGVLRRRARR
ncbi:MAG: hypothetical protein MUC96_17240 [Myxococcaceae bacterium]|jgi:uncharacterized protein (TIGR03382 family)|nr:hypothetical protein [Myxococcaceae bacterium]